MVFTPHKYLENDSRGFGSQPANGRLRICRPEDASQILRIYEPIVRETFISFEFTPPSIGEVSERISNTLQLYPWLVYEAEGDIQGYAYAGLHRARPAYQWSAEVSVYTSLDKRRCGIARALYSALFAILRIQGYYNALAGIALPNDASVALHETLGFHRVGIYRAIGWKLGAWRDVGWWELRLQDHRGPPEPTESFQQLLGSANMDIADIFSNASAKLSR